MTKFIQRPLGAAFLAAVLSSCYYSPYDSGHYSDGGYYDSGYGYGGGPGTTFVYTSSSNWLYDPAVRCYYNRSRNCYYDPWVNGYYPRGYCPRPITAAPHPRGWNGRGTIGAPGDVHDRQIGRPGDRLDYYRKNDVSWAHTARIQNVDNPSSWQNRRAQAAANYHGSQGSLPGRRDPHPPATRDPGSRGGGFFGNNPGPTATPGSPAWSSRREAPPSVDRSGWNQQRSDQDPRGQSPRMQDLPRREAPSREFQPPGEQNQGRQRFDNQPVVQPRIPAPSPPATVERNPREAGAAGAAQAERGKWRR